jgi:hypothetical protein
MDEEDEEIPLGSQIIVKAPKEKRVVHPKPS